MNMRPTKLALTPQGRLRIDWSGGPSREYTVGELRKACPCATCREKRREAARPELLPVLSLEETRPLSIVDMKPVGNYAYQITFSDRHDTGIFTFERLLELGEVAG